MVVADGHAATRFGIRTALAESGMVVCAEAADADSAVAAVLEHTPAVCLLTLELIGGGLAAAERMRAGSPGTAVVFLADSRDGNDVLAAVRAGARGYLLKDTDPARLAAALRGVLDGESAIPRTLVPHLLDAVARGGDHAVAGPLGTLSRREYEVLQALASGLRTDEAGAHLGITDTTVRRHAAAAASKLGAETRDELLQRFNELRRAQNP